ncbi:MAG TPA: CRISPR-associated protein Cas5 [Candidatus Margulisbacteria bacterium]|nr:MAG: CRISPR-associated protein Cas5 [Bacteroidetes bacterium GWF2_43_11]OGI10359.1 MAG: CRISPR-associated protein Cas5 [Candidatus Margulisbacteria bacterium GWE2_39_32]HCT86209.1 CRISPR-associated protein Cas5 [Candidatus Margulisiibacteriota bacterium]
MGNKKYEVFLEISGNTAMWTRPDTGDCPVSYPAPTYSAVKGIFESILWGPAIEVVPTKVEICAPITYHNYQTNYGGPLREIGVMKSGGGYQLLATVLIDVCYRMYAEIVPIRKSSKNDIPNGARKWDKATTSPGHAYQDIFYRRLKRGQCFSIPCLGWKEFGADYFGPFRDDTVVQHDIKIDITSMLRLVFPEGYKSNRNYIYDQNIEIKSGILEYPRKEYGNA